MATEYLSITPAGALLVEMCVSTGHAHTGPDVALDEQCPIHQRAWVFCAGCQEIWCPGDPPQHGAHQGAVRPIANATTLPASSEREIADELAWGYVPE